ncbi:zinc metalloproteinase-disintegrin-like EoMP06 [Ornithodoros turicata]|uniref:zinc metalloproteinase-disintegrin-like EoMP06 n=1 Tax=Ornithodoros turicata TaxID=34597 RepID=UPI003138B911
MASRGPKMRWSYNALLTLLPLIRLSLCVLTDESNGEKIYPQILGRDRRKRDLTSSNGADLDPSVEISFSAFGEHYVLDLRMKQGLLPSRYFEKHHQNDSSVIIYPMQKSTRHCYYGGTVKGWPNSWVAVSTCNGLSGVMHDGKEAHYIHPSSSEHWLFKASKLKVKPWKCGFNHTRERRSVVIQPPYNSNVRSRYVEMIIVNDYKEYVKMKKNKEAVLDRSKQIANIVNALYAPLNIFIALVGVIVWTERDEIEVSSNGDTTLTNFLTYRKEHLAQEHPNDNAQLITDTVLDSSVVGKALKGPICTHEYSGGVNMDHHQVVGVVATTMAHELGHNFGMEHDDKDVKCVCPEKRCIMASASTSPPSPSQWSSCSKHYLQLAFEQGMDQCLWNLPEDIVGPVCGNGFLEAGEQCDCGPPQMCNNDCCDGTTCKLKPHAQCAMGACCDFTTCKVKKSATLCRDTVTECDLPEYCDGQSEFCPVDVYLQDGTECGRAHCFRKQCKSHADQCQVLWGPTGQVADRQCFKQNEQGNGNGNCGYNRINKNYTKCHKDDIMCGTLQCYHLNERLEFGMESAAIQGKVYITDRDRSYTCRSVIIDLGLYTFDPGLSPNGAKCGNNKACLNQKCVPLEKLYGAKCPYNCHNNGVCNNYGHCHCMVGFAPPYCDYPGPGGSVDSGPASDPSAGYGFMVAMYIIFLCIIPMAAIATFSIYYFRNHLKMWWVTKARKAAIKTRAQQLSTGQGYHPAPNKDSLSAAPLHRSSFRDVEISRPVLQSTSNARAAPRPTRPAPPRPTAPKSVSRSASQRSTGASRPVQPPPGPPSLYDDCAVPPEPQYATLAMPGPTVSALARRFEQSAVRLERRPYDAPAS